MGFADWLQDNDGTLGVLLGKGSGLSGLLGSTMSLKSNFTDDEDKSEKYGKRSTKLGIASSALNFLDLGKNLMIGTKTNERRSGLMGMISGVMGMGSGILDLMSGKSKNEKTKKRLSRASGILGLLGSVSDIVQGGFDAASAEDGKDKFKAGMGITGGILSGIGGIFNMIGNEKGDKGKKYSKIGSVIGDGFGGIATGGLSMLADLF